MEKLHGFSKDERLCSKKIIEELFTSGSKSVAVHPIRAVYRVGKPQGKAPICVMMSVSKKHFHHAVDRNRVKRQLREAYRLQKDILLNAIKEHGDGINIAFIWQESKHSDTKIVFSKMHTILQIIADKIAKQYAKDESTSNEQNN